MPRVLVTQAIDPAGIAILEEAGLEVVVREGEEPITREELRGRLAGCEAIIPMPSDRVDAEILAAASLKVVANHAVGVDNVDLDACREHGVTVTNTPGVLTEATAELTMGLILATARRIVEADRFLRAGRYRGWQPLLLRGFELDGATLGIVGRGRIGGAVARLAEAFGMEILHHSRSGGLALDDLLARCDVLSLHCPLTSQTHHLIGERELQRMKRTAIVINTARGPVVDEEALVRALEAGWIAGAGLDVFEREPAVHPGLVARDDVVLLPHIGSATRRCRRRMAETAARNVVAVLSGQGPITPV